MLKKMLFGYSWSSETISYTGIKLQKRIEECVPWRRTHSLFLFHLHFQCNSVNRIFKLLRSGRNKFQMIIKARYLGFWASFYWVNGLFFFPPFILFFYSKLQLQSFHVNTGRCLEYRFWVQGSGSISRLYYLADLCCWAGDLPALSHGCKVVRMKWDDAEKGLGAVPDTQWVQ